MFTIELVLVLFYFSNLLLGLQYFTKLDRILLSWSGINKQIILSSLVTLSFV